MTNRKLFGLLLGSLLLAMPLTAKGQIAGLNTLSILDLSPAARTAGLGLDYLPLFDNDMAVAIDNPSLLHAVNDRTFALNYVGLFGESRLASLSYLHQNKKMGSMLFGLRCNSYGRFDAYDEFGDPQGTFSAADFVMTVGWGFAIDSNFSVGAMCKPIFSQYESYSALAVAFDIAGSYASDDRRTVATLMARNIGAQLMTFDNTREHLPFELSAAFSYKLQDAPFRVFVAANELQRWNLRYEDPLNPTSTTDPFTGEVTTETPAKGFFDNLMRHAQVGVELNIGKAFLARVGYSYRQSRETYGTSNLNMSGFSFGFGFRKKGFEFSYARNNYNQTQAPNYLTLTLAL